MVSLDATNVRSIRRLLSDLGVRLGDVFGADSVLWVEGLTEELCFPLVLSSRDVELGSTVIVGVRSTGELTARRAKAALVWEVYERLTRTNALIPPALAFVFDREGRTEREMEDLIRQSQGAAHFQPRRTYENHLIVPAAIAAVLSNELELSISDEAVVSWLQNNAAAADYKAEDLWDGDVSNPD